MPEVNKEKLDKFEKAMQLVEKKYGKGSIMEMGTKERVNVPVISTGALTLDIALGVGGIPKSRVIEIYGPESSGKTTVALHIIGEVQNMGGNAVFIDAENALDPEYAKNLGVNVSNLVISQPDTGEQALDTAEIMIASEATDLVVVDSVAALVPRAELEGEIGDAHVGLQARLMSQAMRKISGIARKTQTPVVFINQIREKVGVMFGSPEVTPGGRALKFWSSVRIDIRRVETIKKGTDAIGNRVKAKIVKNKMAPPFKIAHFDIIYGKGISKEGCLVDLAIEEELIKKSGPWFSYNGSNIAQGRENTKNYLKENPDISKQIKEKILEKHSLK